MVLFTTSTTRALIEIAIGCVVCPYRPGLPRQKSKDRKNILALQAQQCHPAPNLHLDTQIELPGSPVIDHPKRLCLIDPQLPPTNTFVP
jgi:hypothetical protein